MLPWVAARCQREALRPGSFGAQVYEAADTGEISTEEAPLLVRLAALGGARYHDQRDRHGAVTTAARHPEQCGIARGRSCALSRAAFDETLRYDSPAPFVFRTTPHADRDRRRQDRQAREKVLLLASANRDETRWGSTPTNLDARRRLSGHMGFGVGIHGSVGQMVARLEAEAVIAALANRVKQFDIAGPTAFRDSSGLRALSTMPGPASHQKARPSSAPTPKAAAEKPARTCGTPVQVCPAQNQGRHADAARGVRLRELRWKNSAWLATADTIAGWNGFEIRNAGSGALAGEEALRIGGDEHHRHLEGPQQLVHRIEARRAVGELDVGEDQAGLLVLGERHGIGMRCAHADDVVAEILHQALEVHRR